MMQVKEINMIVDRVSKIKQADILPQNVLNEITRASVRGITIYDYVIDLDKGMVVILGTAFDRQSLLTFKQNLELNPKIDQLNVPISSFEQEFNLEFEVSFVYLKSGEDLPSQTRWIKPVQIAHAIARTKRDRVSQMSSVDIYSKEILNSKKGAN